MGESRWNVEADWNTPAPGELELVRRFLNTWRIPAGEIDAGMREPADELPGLTGDRRGPPGLGGEVPGLAAGPRGGRPTGDVA